MTINNPSYYRGGGGTWWQYIRQLPFCCGSKTGNNLWAGVWESQQTGTQYICEVVPCPGTKRPCRHCGLQLRCRYKPWGKDWETSAWEIVQNHFEGGRGECTALKRSPSGFTGGRQADAQFGKLGKIDWYDCTSSDCAAGKTCAGCTEGKKVSRWWKVR